MTDLAFGLLVLVGGLAFIVYSEPLGARAMARGARFGRELYLLAGAFLTAFGLIQITRGLF